MLPLVLERPVYNWVFSNQNQTNYFPVRLPNRNKTKTITQSIRLITFDNWKPLYITLNWKPRTPARNSTSCQFNFYNDQIVLDKLNVLEFQNLTLV